MSANMSIFLILKTKNNVKHSGYLSHTTPAGPKASTEASTPAGPKASTEVSTTAAPTTTAPSTALPSTALPSTALPSTEAPTTAAPSTAAPSTAAPSTAAPSTAAPTTAAPTTAAPSTAAPTTAAPSTAAPTTAAPTTAAPSTEAPTTAAPTTEAPTTAAPSTAGSTTTITAVSTTTVLSNPCNENPCGAGATCEPRVDQTFACLCLAGDFYNNIGKTCDSAKVFPGNLVLEIEYKEGMDDKKSKEFLDASKRITDELTRVFESDSYSGSIVLKLSQVTPKVWSRVGSKVSADVQIIFGANADILTAEVTEKLDKEKTCEGCLLKGSSFVARELCDESDTPCGQNTACKSRNGTFTCECSLGYITTIYSIRICIACPSGQTPLGSNACESCSFGYSGFNCADSSKLSLVIVGFVLGALLLITLIVLIVVAVRSPKKKSSKKSKKADTGNSYVSQLPVKAPLGAHSHVAPANGLGNGQSGFGNAGVPRIPRATTTSSWDSRTNLEMTQSNSRQNLIPAGRNSRFYEDNEDQYAQSRQSSLYARPQNNAYSQSRPQNNPYAQSQGHSSPYMH
ncbi:hypothetical protein JOQ06_026896 [Pogonophryne albipinna]|uniref:Mucin-13-like n=1 Tax=Pogonophryne albipinna TaxID=1090488 RepID=A0AAD6FP05_9TELE|nr:hypothetical protein JOQ06_026896 [Pogonophryne albipinna]